MGEITIRQRHVNIISIVFRPNRSNNGSNPQFGRFLSDNDHYIKVDENDGQIAHR